MRIAPLAAVVRHRRRRLLAVASVVALVAAGATALARSTDGAVADADVSSGVLKEATVGRRDLSVSERVEGTLEVIDTVAVLHRVEATTATTATTAPVAASGVPAPATGANRVTQRLTGLAEPGVSIGVGDILYTVESTPVVAMIGAQPAWRTLAEGVDDGPDVLQLEQSLAALGYAPADPLELDAHFDEATADAVSRWQVGLGVTPTGEVTLGRVVFLTGPTVVVTRQGVVGQDLGDGDAVLVLAGTTQRVVATVPEELRAQVVPGLVVDVAGTGGTVTRLRSGDDDGTVVVEAVVTPSAPLDLDDGATVRVTIAVTTAAGELTVPADALVSRLDGSYAVQLPDTTDGTHRFVPVDVLAVGSGVVAVRSAQLGEGDTILVPA